MFKEMNERLLELKEQGHRQEKVEKLLEELRKELSWLRESRRLAEARLAAEEKDVERLTRVSISNLLYTVLGKKAEQLEQEKREVVAAKLKFDGAEHALRSSEEQLKLLELELQKLKYWKNDYDRLFKAKEAQMLSENPELKELSEALAALKAEQRELQEAIRAGQSLRQHLQEAEKGLSSAKDWGTYDMLGGGMISTGIKHSRLDEAMDHIHAAQNEMRRFERELHDVGIHDFGKSLEISGLLRFSDYFFDGLIVDWMVQGRIKEALEQVQGRVDEVNRIVSQLESLKRRKDSETENIHRKYVALIENYS
ncbi:hypothetical protein [Paenibacillus brevis]|uniref:Uncharacterized protein n=1 Tax=Paenibacillus brevis TaxID=2841508 RepID=A0ABS6FTJ8_9BACL|nr:hypothetical protein [Paenibacillus brevis]MBU5673439.1 hypothetical protein [Paenibacillus brevis]